MAGRLISSSETAGRMTILPPVAVAAKVAFHRSAIRTAKATLQAGYTCVDNTNDCQEIKRSMTYMRLKSTELCTRRRSWQSFGSEARSASECPVLSEGTSLEPFSGTLKRVVQVHPLPSGNCMRSRRSTVSLLVCRALMSCDSVLRVSWQCRRAAHRMNHGVQIATFLHWVCALARWVC